LDFHPIVARTAIFDKPVMVLGLLVLLILALTTIMLRQRILRGFVYLVTRRSLWVLAVSAAITLASVVTLPFISVSTSRTNLMDEDNPYQRQLNAFLKEFGNTNPLIAVVEGGTLDHRREVSDRLAAALRAEPELFQSVLNRIPIEHMKQQALLYVPLETLENFKSILRRQGFMDPKQVERFVKIQDLKTLIEVLSDVITDVVANPDPIVLKSGAQGKGLDIIKQFFIELEQWLKNPQRQEIKGLENLYLKRFNPRQANMDPAGYLADRQYKRLYLFIRPTTDSDETNKLVPLVERARALAHEISTKVPGVEVKFTGFPALVVDEMNIIQRDMFKTTIIALIGIVLVFLLIFRVVRQTVLANVALLVGLLWTVAFTIVVFGGFNLITSLFAAVLLGLGIDFGIHIIARFNEARGRGADPREAVEQTIMGAGPGLLTGALTTSTAFYTTAISEFTAFAELGVIAGTGMLFMLVAALAILPALLMLRPGPLPKLSRPGTGLKRAAAVRLLLRWPAAVLLVGGVVTVAASSQEEPPLDFNVVSMMPENTESKEALTKMIDESNFKMEFIGIIVDTVDKARRMSKELKKLSSVQRVESVADVMPPDQQKKLDIIRSLRKLFSGLGKRWGNQPPIDPLTLEETLSDLEETFDEVTVLARRHGRMAEHEKLQEVRKQIAQVRRLIVKPGTVPPEPRPGAKERLEAFQQRLFNWLEKGLSTVVEMLNPKKITTKSLPPFARDRFVGRSRDRKKYALYVYPKRSIYDRVFLGEFVKETTQVAKKAETDTTGYPVTFYVHSRMIKEGIVTAAFLAAMAIMLMLLLDFTEDKYTVLALVPLAILSVWSYQMAGWTGAAGFLLVMIGGMAMFDARAVGYMLLAMIPLGMGAAWMLGMMRVFGIDYNLANVVAVPLLMGIGVVYCVHIIHRFRQEGETDVFAAVRHTGGAVFLAAMTTMIGFGALAAGSHGGMTSMGKTMIIGITTCMITSLVVLPAMLRILPRVRRAERAGVRGTATNGGAGDRELASPQAAGAPEAPEQRSSAKYANKNKGDDPNALDAASSGKRDDDATAASSGQEETDPEAEDDNAPRDEEHPRKDPA